jgi:hypothetical protein
MFKPSTGGHSQGMARDDSKVRFHEGKEEEEGYTPNKSYRYLITNEHFLGTAGGRSVSGFTPRQ